MSSLNYGALAFKLSFIWEALIEKFNPSDSYHPDAINKTLLKFLKPLTTFSQNDSPLSIANQLLIQSSQAKEKWTSLSRGLFKERLKGLDSHTKANVLKAAEVLTDVRSKLSQEYQQSYEILKSNYSSAEFKELLNHYPNYDMVKNHGEILDHFSQILIQTLSNKINSTKALKQRKWADIKENLYRIGHEEIIDYLSSSLLRYNWLKENIANIRVPYDQGAHSDSNQRTGTCLQNTLRRLQQLLENPLRTDLTMGSDKVGRMKKAQLNLLNQMFNNPNNIIGQFQTDLMEQVINFDKAAEKIHTFASEEPSLEEYRVALDAIIQPPRKGEPLNGILILSEFNAETKTSSHSHVLNIQVDPKAKIYRIIDDNVGLIEFSSIKELKANMIEYLLAFYPSYSRFHTISP